MIITRRAYSLEVNACTFNSRYDEQTGSIMTTILSSTIETP